VTVKSVEEAIVGRRSIRKYSKKPVDDDTIRELLRLAIYAPSGGLAMGREYPNSFVVIKNSAAIEKFSDKAKYHSLEYIKHVPELGRFKAILSNPDFHLFYGAPVVIVILGKLNDATSLIDGALAAENLMLAAHGKGLGTCWVEWAKHAAKDDELMKELGIQDQYEFIACITLGHPADNPPAFERIPPHILRWID
jgi:nitroreductase